MQSGFLASFVLAVLSVQMDPKSRGRDLHFTIMHFCAAEIEIKLISISSFLKRCRAQVFFSCINFIYVSVIY